MRLINVETLELEEFLGDNVPKYAILSHTWGPEEVSFQWYLGHFNRPDRPPAALVAERSGYIKIVQCCAQAARDGYGYVWVDTCCIDKTSSAELSEAINSMFYWYKTAAVCYAFLSDVNVSVTAHAHDERDGAIRQSRWFTRGWTLQEFLAPREVVFYDAQWTLIAPKAELVELLSSITGIAPRFIDGSDDVYNASIAQRMSWASKRQTTRVEDMAYCLLGIFGVNMPLLYGERDMAFLRLQEEIIRRTEDHSYLAWGFHMPLFSRNYHGLFAKSPADFAGCGEVTHDETRCSAGRGGLVQLTNKGLLLPLRIFSQGSSTFERKSDCLAILRCCRHGDNVLAFPVDHDERKLENDVDVWRVPGGPPVLWRDGARTYGASPLTVFLKTSPPAAFWDARSSEVPIEVRGLDSDSKSSPSSLCLVEVWPSWVWMSQAGRPRRPLSALSQWCANRILLKIVPTGDASASLQDYLIVALDIKASWRNGEFRISRVRPRVVPGREMMVRDTPYSSLADICFGGDRRAVLGESLDDYTNKEELCGNLVSVQVGEGDRWIVDLKVGRGD